MVEFESDIGGTYLLENAERKVLVRTNTVGTITQVTHSANWFNNMCASRYSSKMPWKVFLCYDTDSYDEDVSKFEVGDWEILKKALTRRENISVIDIAASADIEDVFLADLESISTFLGLERKLVPTDIPSGKKGKARMKKLYREFAKPGIVYHEGRRALPLIQALNKQRLIDSEILPLDKIEKAIF